MTCQLPRWLFAWRMNILAADYCVPGMPECLNVLLGVYNQVSQTGACCQGLVATCHGGRLSDHSMHSLDTFSESFAASGQFMLVHKLNCAAVSADLWISQGVGWWQRGPTCSHGAGGHHSPPSPHLPHRALCILSLPVHWKLIQGLWWVAHDVVMPV